MIDASLRASIVNLLRDLRDALGVSIIYITHDLATAYYDQRPHHHHAPGQRGRKRRRARRARQSAASLFAAAQDGRCCRPTFRPSRRAAAANPETLRSHLACVTSTSAFTAISPSARTNPRLFGAFVEHLGRCVYGGIFEPGHPTADAKGFRRTCWRWCASWRRRSCAIPAATSSPATTGRTASVRSAERPRRLDLAWMSTETNQFGTNEFIDWCRAAGIEPMLAVNLGTRGGDAARNMVEYCNHPGGTTLSDLRRTHGWEKPHDVKFWCLGNEMDGPWQMEAKTADGIRPHRARGRQDDEVDRSARIELAACGSSGRRMPTFGQLGGHRARAHVRPCRVHLAAHLSQQLRRRHAGLPRQLRPDGQFHRRGRGDRRRRRRAPALGQAHHAELRRMERLVPHAPQPRRPRQGGLAGGAADPRGDLQHGGCAGLRRLLHLAAQPRRPRHGGLPRPARQRHRADHDRDRRPGLAPDDLPSLRPFQPPRPRPRAAHPDRLADLCRALQRPATARSTSSSPCRRCPT